MGRGRAKAKQAKVARQLKYSGGGTDLDRLKKELGVSAPSPRERHEELPATYPGDADEYGEAS